jgi:hypothetical protein
MKLGLIRVHHVAHEPNMVCPATQPETALHLNTKLYIAEQLKHTSKLIIRNECASGYICDATRDEALVSDWTDVQVETVFGSRKPDVSLYRGEQLIAAIEVRVTHPVDREKATYLQERGIPWPECVK